MWCVDYQSPDSKPGDRVVVLASFSTVQEAEAWLANEIMPMDPEGVDAGYYGIVGPCED